MGFLPAELIAFVVMTVLLTITPGADTFIVIRNVLRGGQKDGICTSLGICFGLFFHAGVSTMGISAVMVTSASLYHCIKIAGAIYLLWLGTKSLCEAVRHKRHSVASQNSCTVLSARPAASFREGLLSNMLNPKPAIFYLALFPQFIAPGDSVVLKVLFLVSIQFFIGICWLFLVSYLISQMKTIIEKPTIQRVLEALSGGVLIFFGIKIAWMSGAMKN